MPPARKSYRVVIVETTIYSAVVRAPRPDDAMTQLKAAVRRGLTIGIRKDGPVMSDMRATLLDDDEPGKSTDAPGKPTEKTS